MVSIRRILGKTGKALLISGGVVGWGYMSLEQFALAAKDKRNQEESPLSAAIAAVVLPPSVPIAVLLDTKGFIVIVGDEFSRARKSWGKFGNKKRHLARVS